MVTRAVYMERIRPFINTELIKVFTGIRRCGKSVMLELVQDELKKSGVSERNFLCLNFEAFRNVPLLTAESLYARIAEFQRTVQGKSYFFFDEIQEVKGFEKCINSCRVDFDCDIYLTGSNARLLSGELATYLSGRYVEFVIYPFSFAEFFDAVRQRDPAADKNAAFTQFLKTGGMPFLANFSGDENSRKQYLSDIYNSVILKDVVRRNNIRDVDALERIIAYVLANVGHSFSATSVSKYFKSEQRRISHETVLNYIKFCTDAFLFYKISRQDTDGKKILTVNEKYYCADHGLRQAVLGTGTQDIDQILENIVCLELLRHGCTVTVGKKGEKEIDFIAERHGERMYFQVCYLLSSEETVQREFGVYKTVRDNFAKFVISMDALDLSRNGIRHLNIVDFLTDTGRWLV